MVIGTGKRTATRGYDTSRDQYRQGARVVSPQAGKSALFVCPLAGKQDFVPKGQPEISRGEVPTYPPEPFATKHASPGRGDRRYIRPSPHPGLVEYGATFRGFRAARASSPANFHRASGTKDLWRNQFCKRRHPIHSSIDLLRNRVKLGIFAGMAKDESLIPSLQLSHEMLRLIAEIDEFKGNGRAIDGQ